LIGTDVRFTRPAPLARAGEFRGTMSNVPSNILRFFRRKPVRSYFKAVSNAAGVPLGLREEQAFELPARLRG
jgi:hypothetical protein